MIAGKSGCGLPSPLETKLRACNAEMPIDAMTILALQNVTKEYSSDGQPVRALDGVTLGIPRGAFVALVGRSGCGKSTLLNLAGAMDFPSTGEVLIDGVSTSALPDAALTNLRREKSASFFNLSSYCIR